MTNPEINFWRGKVGGLTRDRSEDDAELVEARQRLQEQVLIDAIRKALKKAPPLSDELRQRIIAMLD
jgi:hypothetical protein